MTDVRRVRTGIVKQFTSPLPPRRRIVPEWSTADRVRKARMTRGLAQGELADLLGVSQPTISEIEVGTRRTSDDELRHIARAIGVSLAWLRGEL